MTVRWPAEAIWEAVEPMLPGFSLEILPTIDSTNTELMRRARAGRLEPVLLVAEHQTAGRGRLGRSWDSGSGGRDSLGDGAQAGAALPSLTFSLGLPLAPADWSGLSLAVGLSVVESLHPALQLKWPNDVWLHDRKLAGILIETASVGDVRYAVIGIGLNIAVRDGTGLRTPPAALCELLPEVDASAALARIAAPLVQAVQRFARDGFAPLRTAFHARDALVGRELECSDGVTGTARGVDAQGALMVHTAAGLKKISSAEVSVRALVPPNGPVPTGPVFP
ncbi:MAG: biotin--[acetyl-CoA-carboxylase] ligase [Burkholderiales bacterium]|nr:biotin--[acetyl-CoA-carboxylase] ligase [Burkholderiales bacterium]